MAGRVVERIVEKTPDVEIFRYDEKTKRYKKLEIDNTARGIFLRVSEGERGKNNGATITMKLSEQEVAYIALKLFNMVR